MDQNKHSNGCEVSIKHGRNTASILISIQCNISVSGTFPGLVATFRVERIFGYFLLQTYLPTILIVIISWVSFFISMDNISARISLSVTTVLTMATQLSGSKATIPEVLYTKAIDVWMVTCMLFVFISLIEYAFVDSYCRFPADNEDKVTVVHTTTDGEQVCLCRNVM